MLQGLLEKKDLQLIFVLLVGLGFAADVPGMLKMGDRRIAPEQRAPEQRAPGIMPQ